VSAKYQVKTAPIMTNVNFTSNMPEAMYLSGFDTHSVKPLMTWHTEADPDDPGSVCSARCRGIRPEEPEQTHANDKYQTDDDRIAEGVECQRDRQPHDSLTHAA